MSVRRPFKTERKVVTSGGLSQVSAPTRELEQLLLPDKLDQVLAALLRRRVIFYYKVGADVTVVAVPEGRELTLLDWLERD